MLSSPPVAPIIRAAVVVGTAVAIVIGGRPPTNAAPTAAIGPATPPALADYGDILDRVGGINGCLNAGRWRDRDGLRAIRNE